MGKQHPDLSSGQSCTSDTTDFRGGIWGVTGTSSAAGDVVTVGPAMQIRWRDVDLTAFATHPLTPGQTIAGNPGPEASTPSPPTASPPSTTQPPHDTTTPTSTIPETTDTPVAILTGKTAAASSADVETATTGPAFITLTAMTTTPPPLTRVTVTIAVSTVGSSTIMSTMVTSVVASSVASLKGGDGDGTLAAGSAASSSAMGLGGTTTDGKASASTATNTRALTAAIIMAVLFAVAALGIFGFIFLMRRRRRQCHALHRFIHRQHQVRPDDAGGGAGGFEGTGTAVVEKARPTQARGLLDVDSSVTLSSVGVGAWVQRRRSVWHSVWKTSSTKAASAASWVQALILPRIRGRSAQRGILTGDGSERRLGRSRAWRWGRRDRQASPATGTYLPPIAELPSPTDVHQPPQAQGHYAELEGSAPAWRYVGNAAAVGYDDDDSDSFVSLKKDAPRLPLLRSMTPLSWMSRVSRYLRGGASRTPSLGSASAATEEQGSGSRHSIPASISTGTPCARDTLVTDDTASSILYVGTSRWSNATTRTDTASVVTDHAVNGGSSETSHEGSWEAFSQSREGLGKVSQVRQVGVSSGTTPGGGPGGRGHRMPRRDAAGGLTVPGGGSVSTIGSLVRLPSPAATVRSDRRFSRLSDGTFGGMEGPGGGRGGTTTSSIVGAGRTGADRASKATSTDDDEIATATAVLITPVKRYDGSN